MKIISPPFQLQVHVLHVSLVLLLLQMLLEPSYQVPDVRKLLIVEVQARTFHSDQLSDGLLVLVHVDQEEELGELL